MINEETFQNDINKDTTPIKLQETDKGRIFAPVESETPRNENRGRSHEGYQVK